MPSAQGYDYRVLLDGGATVAVTHLDVPPTPDSEVWLYHKPSGTWKGKHNLQAVFAHGNYWKEPEEETTINIPGPIPSDPPPPPVNDPVGTPDDIPA